MSQNIHRSRSEYDQQGEYESKYGTHAQYIYLAHKLWYHDDAENISANSDEQGVGRKCLGFGQLNIHGTRITNDGIDSDHLCAYM